MKTFLQHITGKNSGKLIIFLILAVAAIAHGWNMFHYPYFENDEGTYLSYAWSFLKYGTLDPYTYWYDHAPAGWILIALWSVLSGGFFTFGPSANSGRVLMLLLHVLSSYFLLYIAKKVTGKMWPGILAVAIFSFSPLAVYFQRRVLLDNIMIFWILLSWAVLLKSKLKLRHIYLSALCFGIAVLTKENAIFLLPAFIYFVYSRSHQYHRRFAVIKWITISGIIISLYFIYAIFKGELLPTGTFGDTKPHVSLIGTLEQQLSRGSNLPFWQRGSEFYENLIDWYNRDKYLVIVGIFVTVANSVIAIKHRAFRMPALLALSFWAFLMRGKLVIVFYIIPLIPILALNVGLLVDLVIKRIGKNIVVYHVLMVIILVSYSAHTLYKAKDVYLRDETTNQNMAIEWIKRNLPQDSYIVIDDYAFIDLHDERNKGDKVFKNADWYWKVTSDPAIRIGKYENQWTKVQYIAVTDQMLKQIKIGSQDIIKQAFDNSFPIQEWTQNSSSYRDLKNYVSTNGDWVSIYKVKGKDDIFLQGSWAYYKAHFIKSYGQVVDPATGYTTSEGQSYAMLRSVFLSDRPTFDGVWQWTKDHMQHRSQDSLLSWQWKVNRLGDSASAADADQDIALALIFASQKWQEESYLLEAKQLLSDIWDKEVVRINGRYYLNAGSNMTRPGGILVNPSYLSPGSYRIFAEVDKNHPWESLATDSYSLLNDLSTRDKEATEPQLPPNWIFVSNGTGALSSADKYITGGNIDDYGFDAFRLFFRVALDASWFESQEATEYLTKYQDFFSSKWKESQKIAAIYDAAGKERVTYSSLSTDAGALAVLFLSDKKTAEEMYKATYEKKYNLNEGYWGDKNNYYDQNWSWFITALYTQNLPNTTLPLHNFQSGASR